MAQVFISYAREDLGFVGRLADDLRKKAGLNVWQDLSSMGGGDPWVEKITAAIKDSQYVIVVLSPDSAKKSDWVLNEILLAKNHKRKIIPLFYRPCDVPLPLLSLDYIDVHGKNYEKNFAALLKALDVDLTKPSILVPARSSKLPFGMSTRHLALTGMGVVAAILVGAGIYASSLQPDATGTPPPLVTTQSGPAIPATTEPALTTPPITESPPPTEPPTTEPPPTDSPTVEPPPPTQPPTTEPLSSAYTSNPPSIDGAMTKAHWKDALMAHALPLGNLYYLNDDRYLYLLVDLPGDKDNNLHGKQSYDDLLLVFDVDKDGNRDSNDVYYRFQGKGSKFEFCTWLAPVPEVECDIKKRDRSMTSWGRPGFNISPQFLVSRHKFWELRIDLDEIKGILGDLVYTGVATSQDGMSLTSINSMPQISDFSPDSFDFGNLIEIYLDEEPSAP